MHQKGNTRNANGLQDSQISLIDDEITDTYRDAIVVLDEQTNCFSDFQDNVGGYVLSLQEIIDKHLIIETVEDFKKYLKKKVGLFMALKMKIK